MKSILNTYRRVCILLLLSAGQALWMVYTLGDNAGRLYELDPLTGETLNSLELVGDHGRSVSDAPVDMEAEAGDLWVLTARQLLQIKMP